MHGIMTASMYLTNSSLLPALLAPAGPHGQAHSSTIHAQSSSHWSSLPRLDVLARFPRGDLTLCVASILPHPLRSRCS